MRKTLFFWAFVGIAAGSLLDCVSDAAGPGDGGGGADATPGDGSGSETSSDAGSTDAPSGDGSTTDTGTDAGPACDVRKAFGTPSPLVAINTGNIEEFPRISPDGLELFVTRYPAGDPLGRRHIDRHARASVTSPWILKETEAILSSPTDDAGAATGLTLTPDGLTGYLQFYPGGGGNARIYASTRGALNTAGWNTPIAVNGIGTTGTDEAPYLSASGNRIYFFSNRAGAGFHVYYANRNVNGFDTPVAAFLVSPVEDRYPVVSADELTLYIGAYGPTPDAGPASMNVYVTTRASTSDGFGAPVFVPELNAPSAFTAPSWISADGCSMLLFSNRTGSFDVFTAVKPR